MLGDCKCGHSLIYHAPFVGCLKCDCDEFRRWLSRALKKRPVPFPRKGEG